MLAVLPRPPYINIKSFFMNKGAFHLATHSRGGMDGFYGSFLLAAAYVK